MKIIYSILGVIMLLLLLNVHVWPQQLKGGVYKESTIEKMVRIMTGRIDD